MTALKGMLSRIVILDVCLKEIKKLPKIVQNDLLAAIELLERGENLIMPLSRPMPSIEKGCHELRFKDKSGQFRVIYIFVKKSEQIYLIHAFMKKTQATSRKNVELAKKRLRGLK